MLANQKQELPVVAMFFVRNVQDITNIISAELGSNQHNCFRKDVFILAYHKRELYVVAMLFDQNEMKNFCRGLPNNISAKFNPNCFRGEDFALCRPIRNENCL